MQNSFNIEIRGKKLFHIFFCKTVQPNEPNLAGMVFGKRRFRFVQMKVILLRED
jgi:hypothetical protein